jgi:hypothetical protein
MLIYAILLTHPNNEIDTVPPVTDIVVKFEKIFTYESTVKVKHNV